MNRDFSFRFRKSRRGMVLLEVVAALTIFALVAFSLIVVLSTAMDTAKVRNEVDAVVRGLGNKMALLHASRILATDNDLDDDGSGISYHLTIRPEQMQDQKHQAVNGMYRATITARWKSSSGEMEDRTISELVYQP